MLGKRFWETIASALTSRPLLGLVRYVYDIYDNMNFWFGNNILTPMHTKAYVTGSIARVNRCDLVCMSVIWQKLYLIRFHTLFDKTDPLQCICKL